MVNEKRNANVVAMLVASLTVGAGVLLVLEPHPKTDPAGTTLAAVRGDRVNSLAIEWAESGAPINLENAIWITDNGDMDGETGGDGRLVVFSSASEKMSQPQQQRVLSVIKSLSDKHGLPDRNVYLTAASQSAQQAGARALFELLRKKGFVGNGR
ncbi:MAG: hypothetical protein ACKVS9_17000 [Phycisphaerae bacterium]